MAWDWDRWGSRSGGTDGDDGGIEVPDPLGRGHRVQAEVKLQWLVLDPMCRGHRGRRVWKGGSEGLDPTQWGLGDHRRRVHAVRMGPCWNKGSTRGAGPTLMGARGAGGG